MLAFSLLRRFSHAASSLVSVGQFCRCRLALRILNLRFMKVWLLSVIRYTTYPRIANL